MDSAERTNDEKDGRVSCSCVNSARGIGDGNSTRRASRGVNRIVAGAVVRNEFEAGREHIDEFLIEATSHLRRKRVSAFNDRIGF